MGAYPKTRKGRRSAPFSSNGAIRAPNNLQGTPSPHRLIVLPALCCGRVTHGKLALKQVPERLVVNRVVELHLGAFDDASQLARAAVGYGLL